MEVATLQAEPRTHLGSKYTRRLRQQGKIPAIIYGHGENPEAVAISSHEVERLLEHHARVIELNMDGRPSQLLIKAVQYDYLGTTPIHLDLMRVDLNERIHVNVDIELRGTAEGTQEGGTVSQLLNTIEIECLITSIPESLRPSIAHLGINDDLLVKDLDLPEGVTAITDEGEQVAICRVPTVSEEAEEGAEGEGGEPAMPEVIGRTAEEGSGEGDK